MSNKATYLRVGLFIVVGLALSVGVVMFLGRNTVSDGLVYETYFGESVQGLDIGASVKYRGVTLGQVTQIALVSAVYPESMPADDVKRSYQLVVVRYVVDPSRLGAVPSSEAAVAQGLRARLAAQGLTGLAYLELDFVAPERFPALVVPWTPQAFNIPSMPSTVSQVQDAVTSVLDRLKSVDYAGLVARTNLLLDDMHHQLTVGEVSTVLRDTAAITSTLRRTLDAAGLDETAADLRAAASALRGLASGKETAGMVAAASRAADQLADAARKLPPLIAALQSSTRRADDGLADLTATLAPVLRDARAAVNNLRDTSEALRRYPASSLFGGPPPRESRN